MAYTLLASLATARADCRIQVAAKKAKQQILAKIKAAKAVESSLAETSAATCPPNYQIFS